MLNKIGWIYIVFLSFWSRIKRVHNNSQRVEFDKWHTFDTFMKLILKKHSIWNVSLIILELFFKFLSEDSGADELNNQNWCGLQEINIFLGNYRKIFFFFAKLYIGLHYYNPSSILFRRDKYSGVSLIQTLAFPREYFWNRLYDRFLTL